jgi:antitoxin CptB
MNPECDKNAISISSITLAPIGEEVNSPEAISIWRKRLLFRAWHRGTREADLLIGNFAERTLPELGEEGLKQFEALLACPDPDLYDWMTGRSLPPEDHENHVMQLLREFRFVPADR